MTTLNTVYYPVRRHLTCEWDGLIINFPATARKLYIYALIYIEDKANAPAYVDPMPNIYLHPRLLHYILYRTLSRKNKPYGVIKDEEEPEKVTTFIYMCVCILKKG